MFYDSGLFEFVKNENPAPSLRSGAMVTKGRIPLPTSLIPAAANRQAEWRVAEVVVDGAAVVFQGAEPCKGPGPNGGGPPIPVAGHEDEISVDEPKAARHGVEPKAARQGSEARRVGGSRVR